MAAPPRLLHLNADASWLLTLPLLDGAEFTIAIDPWLSGDQVDFFPGFSKQHHGQTKPLVSDIRELDARIDAVVVTHDFTDHTNHHTLSQLPSSVPILAGTAQAVNRVRGFKHFQTIVPIPSSKTGKMPETDLSPLPKSITLVYLPTLAFTDIARLHGALAIVFERPGRSSAAIFLSPHGVPPAIIELWRKENPEVEVLALLHSLDQVNNPWWLGGQIALGWPSAVKLAQALKPRYLVSHHDEDDKEAVGLVSLVLKRIKASLPAVQDELKQRGLNTQVKAIDVGDTLEL